MIGKTNASQEYDVETIASNGYTVVKYPDGRMEAYAEFGFDAVNGTAVTGTGLVTQGNNFPMPAGFVANPVMVASAFVVGDVFSHLAYNNCDYEVLETGLDVRIIHHSSTSGRTGQLKVIMFGRWQI